MENFLDELKKYFDETPHQKILEDWNKSIAYDDIGPTVDEYLQYINQQNYIKIPGVIHFDPVNLTKKHNNQANWKRMALVMIDGDICNYYAWFIKKRYNLDLNNPLRNAHISFINDSLSDIMKGLNCNEQEAELIWNSVKDKWSNKKIEIVLNVDARGNEKHWWLNIPEEFRTELHDIRTELGLSRPFFGLHMSIGTSRTGVQGEHAKYIIDGIRNDLIK